MATTKLTMGAPGIAAYEEGGFTGIDELFFNDYPTTTTNVKVGENVDLPLGAVVAYDGTTITLHQHGTGQPYGILVSPVKTGAGQSTNVDVFRSGHFIQDALTFDASYDTDEKKQAAFNAVPNTTIYISKRRYQDQA